MPSNHTKLDQATNDTRSTFSLLTASHEIVSLPREDQTATLELDVMRQDELSAHFACYLCIIVFGFVERSTKQLVGDYIQTHTQKAPQVYRFVQNQLNGLWGINYEKFKTLITTLDPEWWTELKIKKDRELQSLAGLSALRNKLAHGEDITTTVGQIDQYFEDVSNLMIALSELLV